MEVKVLFNGDTKTIDLDKPAPFEMLEKNYKGQHYVPISLVREIARALGWKVTDQRTTTAVIGQSLLITAGATVNIINGENLEVDAYSGTSQDMLSLAQVQKTTFPATARVLALAIKSALKWRFKFFESDYFGLVSEEAIGEDTSTTTTTAEVAASVVSDDLGAYIDSIGKCTTVAELEVIGLELKELIASKKVSASQAKTLRMAYNNKNQLL